MRLVEINVVNLEARSGQPGLPFAKSWYPIRRMANCLGRERLIAPLCMYDVILHQHQATANTK